MKARSLKLVGLLILLAQCALATVASAAGRAEHVVVLVWDGMRPDFITPQYCPNLYALATNGVFFKNHHPVYVSSTEVNGTALATGVHPGRSHVIANTEYRQEISVTGTVVGAICRFHNSTAKLNPIMNMVAAMMI